MATTTDAQLDFTWLSNTAVDTNNGSDRITFLIYNFARQAYAKAYNAAARSTLNYNLPVPGIWSGDTVYVWAFLVSAYRKLSSNSVYIGSTGVQ